MKDKFFFDTNTLIYLLSDEINKHKIAVGLYKSVKDKTISTQVLNEFVNVCFKKKLIKSNISEYIKILSLNFDVSLISLSTIQEAIRIKEKYAYSYYDSAIIAAALQNNCNILYTEDMQHEQIIEDSLTIINPFK